MDYKLCIRTCSPVESELHTPCISEACKQKGENELKKADHEKLLNSHFPLSDVLKLYLKDEMVWNTSLLAFYSWDKAFDSVFAQTVIWLVTNCWCLYDKVNNLRADPQQINN